MNEEQPSPPSSPTADRLRDPARVAALIDGVFAIVLTILVLEIAVPGNLSHESLGRVLEELRPMLAAWVVSFLIVGMHWIGHRDLFAWLCYANRDLVWLNLLFLLPVSLIPFGASVIGRVGLLIRPGSVARGSRPGLGCGCGVGHREPSALPSDRIVEGVSTPARLASYE